MRVLVIPGCPKQARVVTLERPAWIFRCVFLFITEVTIRQTKPDFCSDWPNSNKRRIELKLKKFFYWLSSFVVVMSVVM